MAGVRCVPLNIVSRLPKRKCRVMNPVCYQLARGLVTDKYPPILEEETKEYYMINSDEGLEIYENHIQTSTMQKVLLAVGSAFMGLYNPTRQDMIAALGETTGYQALKWMHAKMLEDPVGYEILRIKPRITGKTAPVKELRKLPDGTLGREYARQDTKAYWKINGWVNQHIAGLSSLPAKKISADTRTPVKFVDDKELAYVIQRYRDVHDFLHTLSGIPTVSISGEIAVKWFEMAQTRLPLCALSAIFGPLNINVTAKQRKDLLLYYIPWAISAGLKAKFVLNVFYEKRFEDPIELIREELNLIQAPKVE